MRVLVTGGRDFSDYEAVSETLDQMGVTVLIHGCATGADALASRGQPNAVSSRLHSLPIGLPMGKPLDPSETIGCSKRVAPIVWSRFREEKEGTDVLDAP